MSMNHASLLEVTDLAKHFPTGGGFFSRPTGWVKAVNGVSFSIDRGESLGLVGESGCGKSTLARLVVRLLTPTGGSIRFGDREISALDRHDMQPLRKRMQIIFQDPHASLDPRMTVAASVTEPLLNGSTLSKREQRSLAADLLATVGLQTGDLDRYPHEFSGGQRQRIGIARALCVRPELVVADEPVSALDVSIQAQILNLMKDLQQQFGLAYLFISHDISVVEQFCDRTAVMYAGHLVEIADANGFHGACRHPYTRALVAAVPRPDPQVTLPPVPTEGEPPDSADLPSGCPYHPRCPHAFGPCPVERPPLIEVVGNHQVACWLNGGKGVEGGVP
ncbi:MAG: ATP-binding cassette domain-containing protein [Desulfosarcina sp.]|nr:ATP-binding cassette domain-containing protein [Desulfosarcina sp.]MBC2743307.1 ATP-binding cassette domain-containing protein [Desulfosarcina sp.]MBC2766217.1 ATP-binding cassette domain-containing protein [Desulfosarcina sp.]